MIVTTNARGFEQITLGGKRLIAQSSAMLEDCLDTPGSSALWVGLEHQLNRGEVWELVGRLQAWLETGRLTSHSDMQR